VKKILKIVGILILVAFISYVLIKAKEGDKINQIYPETTNAPILKLILPEDINPVEDVIRYTPYGIWENAIKHKDGIAYEPANEMQFYLQTEASDYLAAAPGVVTRNEAFENSVGLVSIKYGENYVITYLHILPNKNLRPGDRVELGEVIGKMQKTHNPHHGEETWWEIQVTIRKDGLHRTRPPYDYFDKESQEILDKMAEKSNKFEGLALKKPYWTISDGCSWIKHTGTAEWWDSNRFGGFVQKESEEEFIKNINPNWEVTDDKGLIIGPTDDCHHDATKKD